MKEKICSRRDFLRSAAFASVSLTALIQSRASDKASDILEASPNIIFILADDMGIGDISSYNDKSLIETPNLDKLAEEGVSFTDVHTSGSRCLPSRYGIMTGQHFYFRKQEHHPLKRTGNGREWSSVMTLPRMLQQNGYETVMYGKWHLDMGWQRTYGKPDYTKPCKGGPIAWGFDEYFGVPHSANAEPLVFVDDQEMVGELSPKKFDPETLYSRPVVAAKGWSNEAIMPTLTEKTVSFIRNRKGNEKPFFLYFAMTAPHTPLAPKKRFVKEGEEHLYFGFVRQVDWSVGQVLKALDAAGLRENTLVIFSSDNGSPATAYDATKPGRDMKKLGKYTDHSANGPWRGFKLSNWEGGHRVPFILRWPGMVDEGSWSDTPFQLTDLFPTFAAIIDEKLPKDVAIDGRNVMSIWTGAENEDAYADRVFVHADHPQTGAAVRQGKWKLITRRKKDLLFNLEKDPGERNNLIDNYPEVAERLEKALQTESRRLIRSK